MKALILYGTIEGQTRKVAEYVAEALRGHGDEPTLVDVAHMVAPPDLTKFDAAILAASIHAHHYQEGIVKFARANREKLNAMPSMFLSVSLSAAGTTPEDFQGCASCAEAFRTATGWRAAEIYHVAGAFRFSEYDFFKNWVMHMIARERKVPIQPNQDFELTDWTALARIVEDFRGRAAAAKAGFGASWGTGSLDIGGISRRFDIPSAPR